MSLDGAPSTVRVYAHWSDAADDHWPWPNFLPSEMACSRSGKLKIDTRLMDMLQATRRVLGEPMIVNSGFRSRLHNTLIGGALRSFHVRGMAADIRTTRINPEQLIAIAKRHGARGIGRYPRRGFVHLDVRTAPAEWAK